MAVGAGLTLVEGSSKLFGRSIFANYLLAGISMSALVLATAEYGLGAAVLLLVAYRFQILGLFRRTQPRPERFRYTRRAVKAICVIALSVLVIVTADYGLGAVVLLLVVYGCRLRILGLFRHMRRPERLRYTRRVVKAIGVISMAVLVIAVPDYGLGAAVLLLVAYGYRLRIRGLFRLTEPRPQRLQFTWQAVTAIVVFAGCNIMGRGMMVLAMTSAGTALATINAITFAVSTMTYSNEVWQTGQRFAAMLVPLLIVLGLAVSIEAWHISARPWGVIWSIGSALSGLIYMALSRSYVERGGAEADQFQALGTSLGVVGLAIWAKLAGEDPSVGWSWEVLLALLCTALMTVVIPRYLHMRARKALGDAVYTILWSVIPLLGLLVDLIMEQKVPTMWQIVGMSWISAIAAGASLLRLPPEAKAVQWRRFRGMVKRLKKLVGCRLAYG
ncbi:Threonine/homoserine efflux transporter RhtA [Actinomadura mexicana]|uniref:Threonine/homoserine efflux transporter RhtA n=2 Tax=Actinomadura mexicana TaxID=134959 RepID=A0A239D377_9ACTN|nr:Threonine/homoserine efflux transporter RhtA [Actinomadura mexicana]